MSKDTQALRNGAEMHVTGAVPSGLTKKVVSSLGKQVKDVFQRHGTDVSVKGMRFIPSTKVDLGEGAFEVLASTVVEVAGNGKAPARPEAFDSVITVGRLEHTGQVLKGVKIPALERS